MIPFFCGENSECDRVSEKSLDIAIKNMEKNFLIVGITEQIDDFFAVIEKVFPTYFTNITAVWRSEGIPFNIKLTNRILLRISLGATFSYKTAAPKKPKVDADVYQKIVEKMNLEIQFYNYVKIRFYKLKSELLLNNKLPDNLISMSNRITKLYQVMNKYNVL